MNLGLTCFPEFGACKVQSVTINQGSTGKRATLSLAATTVSREGKTGKNGIIVSVFEDSPLFQTASSLQKGDAVTFIARLEGDENGKWFLKLISLTRVNAAPAAVSLNTGSLSDFR